MKTMRGKIFCFAICLCLFSCKKKDGTKDPDPSSTFTAKVNGKLVVFAVQSSTLTRSTGPGEKRLEIHGLSADGQLRLFLTVAEESDFGNTVPSQDNMVIIFNEDNPATPQDESDIETDTFFTLSTPVGNGNGWFTDVYRENGHIIITGNSTAGTTGTVTGTFNVVLVNAAGSANYFFTEGSFNDLEYRVVN